MHDGVDCQQNICGLVNDCRCVSCTNAECWLTAGVSSSYHAWATRCQNQICFLHQGVGQFQRRHINPADDVLRCTCCNRCIQYNLCSCNGGFLCPWVRRNQNCISGFQTNQGLENGGRSRVCGRNNGCNDTDWFCNPLGTECLVFFYDTASLGILVSVIDIFRCIVVLDDLVFHNAHASFCHCHLCQRNPCLIGCQCRCTENTVYLFLCVGSKFCLCCPKGCQFLFQCRYSVDQTDRHLFCFFRHMQISYQLIFKNQFFRFLLLLYHIVIFLSISNRYFFVKLSFETKTSFFSS